MRQLRALWRLLRACVHLVHGIAVTWWFFPKLDAAGRAERIRWWSVKLVRVLGLRCTTHGTPTPGAKLMVANHISWLDIAAIHVICPQARFVSKADVKHWPLVGWLVAAVGTLFIERERKRDALRVVHQMAEALRAGDTVAVFPEGTTSSGESTLPFHANLLQAAIATDTLVQPVVLRFSDPAHAVSPAAMFVGDTTLAQSVWAIVCAEGLQVCVQVLPVVACTQADRRLLAQQLRDLINAELDRGVRSA